MQKREMFPAIPNMNASGAAVEEVVHYGAGNYVVTVGETKKADYLAYLNTLERRGFTKVVDNGEGLNGSVFNVIYTKEKLVLTVTYVTNLRKTYISAALELPLSEHLFRKEEYTAGNGNRAQTSLHMLELWHFGNSFVFRLKNGRFVVSDGGMRADIPYLLDYLEKLVPEGEKPVVEAWIFSHGHFDHCGVMGAIIDDISLAERFYVEGVYYNEPNDAVTQLDPIARVTISWIKAAAGILKTTKGMNPEIYRPQTGQRYYFNDITMDIILGQEQLPRANYSGDFNDSSTWCMFTVEGQKCLFCGDGEKGGMRFIMDTYDREYLNVDVFTLMHHGFNTRIDFTDYCTVKTALFTVKDRTPLNKEKQNEHLRQSVQEYLTWGGGTKILTFPYTVGSYECLPATEWIYHEGLKRPLQPNLDVLFPSV
ncbi:MAG: hypothetical protein LBQ48_00180 [Oscillospiraceae bacterium]|nr:hypothetical protein [Oscillospiraceae bacterium]